MYPALTLTQIRRGAVFEAYYTEFDGQKTHTKYCVVMEDYSKGKEDIAIVFTTHRTEFDSDPSTVRITDGDIHGIRGDTLIQCNNARVISVNQFCDIRKMNFLDTLSDENMDKVDSALEYAYKVEEEIFIRMIG